MDAQQSPIDRLAINKSRVTNGSQLLPGVDGRSSIARRFKDLVYAIVADQGGLDRMSESRAQLIRRFAAAAVIAEQLEAKLVEDEEIDVQEHALLCSTLVRLGSRLGIDRRSRNVTPSVADYLSAAHSEDAQDDA